MLRTTAKCTQVHTPIHPPTLKHARTSRINDDYLSDTYLRIETSEQNFSQQSIDERVEHLHDTTEVVITEADRVHTTSQSSNTRREQWQTINTFHARIYLRQRT